MIFIVMIETHFEECFNMKFEFCERSASRRNSKSLSIVTGAGIQVFYKSAVMEKLTPITQPVFTCSKSTMETPD